MSDDFDPFDAPAAGGAGGDDDVFGTGNTAAAAATTFDNEVTGDDLDESGGFAAAPPTIVVASPVALAAPVSTRVPASAKAATFAQDETDAINAWQEQHNKYLDEKLRRESDKISEAREAARAAYDKLVVTRQEMIANNKAANRDAEASFVADRDKALTSGETWERVAFFCDLQLKAEGRDTSRLRELLIQLKH